MTERNCNEDDLLIEDDEDSPVSYERCPSGRHWVPSEMFTGTRIVGCYLEEER